MKHNWASLTLTWRTAQWSTCKELWQKWNCNTLLVIWYDGSCRINLQILLYKCFVMWEYLALCTDIFGTVNHASNNETAKITVAICILGWYSKPCHGEWNGKDYWHYVCLACVVNTINNIDEDRLKIICLARKMLRYIIKKVCMWSLFIMKLKLLLYTAYIVCVVQSTGAMQLQAHLTMLLESV